MIFSSVLFMTIFLPCTLAVYFLSPRTWRNGILFVVSLIFYAWGEPIYVLIMIFSTIVDFTCGQMIGKYGDDAKKKKMFLLISVFINLGLLGFFKYSDFLIGNVNSLFNTAIPLLKLGLPIGISFYTFQTMSYTIDVYLGNCPVQNNIVSFGCYVSMFPQLIAGPIVRYVDVVKELNGRRETMDDFAQGIKRFSIGLGKKVLLANNIGMLWDVMLSRFMLDGTLSVLGAWIGLLAFAFQLYFDFSGYSCMAIGLGRMFGFRFPENFNYPYISTSISEFWRRWHMTLGTWFREYVYIPLGGNRVSQWKWVRNLFIVWFLTGLWHGAAWNFIVWGLYFGVILGMEKLFLNAYLKRMPRVVAWLYTMLLIAVAWCLFAIESLPLATRYIGLLFGIGSSGLTDTFALYQLSSYALVFVIVIIAATPFWRVLVRPLMKPQHIKLYTSLQFALCIVCILSCLPYLVDASYNPFLYFRF